jgi:hypothetical protein
MAQAHAKAGWWLPVQAGLHWSKLLTARLGPRVKLVGSTISCEPAWEGGNFANPRRQNPHVQSYLMATDQVAPHPDKPSSVYHRPLSEAMIPCVPTA